jgi:hypothetical protein
MSGMRLALCLVTLAACGAADDAGGADAATDATQTEDPTGRWVVESMDCTSGQSDCASSWDDVTHLDVVTGPPAVLTWSIGAEHSGTWAGRCVTIAGGTDDGRQRRTYDWCRDAADFGFARAEIGWYRPDNGIDVWALEMRRHKVTAGHTSP